MDGSDKKITMQDLRAPKSMRVTTLGIMVKGVIIAAGDINKFEVDMDVFKKGIQKKPVEILVRRFLEKVVRLPREEQIPEKVSVKEVDLRPSPAETDLGRPARYIVYPGLRGGRMITPTEVIKQHGLTADEIDYIVFDIRKPGEVHGRKKLYPMTKTEPEVNVQVEESTETM